MRKSFHGDPCGNRTRVTGVRGRCLNRLTNGPYSASRLSAKLPSADALKGSRRPFGSRLVSASRTRPSMFSGRNPARRPSAGLRRLCQRCSPLGLNAPSKSNNGNFIPLLEPDSPGQALDRLVPPCCTCHHASTCGLSTL